MITFQTAVVVVVVVVVVACSRCHRLLPWLSVVDDADVADVSVCCRRHGRRWWLSMQEGRRWTARSPAWIVVVVAAGPGVVGDRCQCRRRTGFVVVVVVVGDRSSSSVV